MPYKDLEKQRKYQREWQAKRRADYFLGKSCVRCGEIEGLELDHIDPSQKVAHNIWSWSEERREAELIKCQILCGNCHKDKTRNEKAKGEASGKAKITETDALYILNSRFPTKVLAEKFKLDRRTIQRIRSGKLWSHLSK